jgi:hypothetical protein
VANVRRFISPALVILLAIALGASTGKLFTDSDTSHYLHLAAGQPVMQPFAARQLGPLIVRALVHLGLSVEQGFWVLGVASLAFFAGSMFWLLEQARAPAWLRWAVLGLYFWGLLFGGMVLPDLFYAALLSGFLLLVWAGREGWASALLFPLMLARESTVLVLLCWLYVGWRTLNWGRKLGSVAAVVTGALAVRALAAGASGNREGLSPVLYLLGKMPWNFAKNFLGLDAWANLNPSCGAPVWHRAVHLGPLHDIGYCRLEPEYPVRLVAYALATFGLLPLLLWWARKLPRTGLLVRFCFLYGVASYLMAGLLGYSVQRLYGYGWPAFLVGLPMIVGRLEVKSLHPFLRSGYAVAFAMLSLLASWLEWRLDKVPLLLAELLVWGLGVAVLLAGLGSRSQKRDLRHGNL